MSPNYSQSGYGLGNAYVPTYTVTKSVVPVADTSIEPPVEVGSLPRNQAQVIVRVPADAKLFAEGQATTLTGAERTFLTPDLQDGRTYSYTLKVEFKDEGEDKTATKQIVVRGGHRTTVVFAAFPVTTSPVTVDLPEKAKLFVDGIPAAANGGRQMFRTPELTKGKPYTYQFRAEVEVEGKTDIRVRNVTFRAGEPVAVDFNEVDASRTASR